MTKKAGHPKFYKILKELADLHSRKNTDYAKGGKQGALGNFHRVAQFKQMYPGFDWSSSFGTAIDFMLKQLDAAMILTSTQRKSITGEPVPARLNDIIVYTTIARILWEENETTKPRVAFKKISKAKLSKLPQIRARTKNHNSHK